MVENINEAKMEISRLCLKPIFGIFNLENKLNTRKGLFGEKTCEFRCSMSTNILLINFRRLISNFNMPLNKIIIIA